MHARWRWLWGQHLRSLRRVLFQLVCYPAAQFLFRQVGLRDLVDLQVVLAYDGSTDDVTFLQNLLRRGQVGDRVHPITVIVGFAKLISAPYPLFAEGFVAFH